MKWSVPHNLWENGDVWVIGGGPSIIDQFKISMDVVEKVRSGADLSLYSPYMESIHSKHVVGINIAYRIGEWIDFVFFGDDAFFLKYQRELYKWSGLKVSCATSTKDVPWVRFLERRNHKMFGLSETPSTVCWNKNSGAASLSMICHTGAKRIFLLGFDMDLGSDSFQHWHNVYRTKNKPVDPIHLPFERHLKGFPDIAREAKNKGVQIFNVSPNSKIEVFPKLTLQEALNV